MFLAVETDWEIEPYFAYIYSNMGVRRIIIE
jgi:hypothetical protein